VNIRIIIAIIIAVALAASHWKAYTSGKKNVQIKWDLHTAEIERLARKQQDDNRDKARSAEVRYVDRERVRVETITEILKELPNETANLESCRLDAGDIGLLNKAARTAREN
jgi:hypothetical protein